MPALKMRAKKTNYAYEQGRQARKLNQSKRPPYNNSPEGFCLQHWWLAGWNDKDIELLNKGINHV